MSFRRRGTEGSGWQPSAASEAAVDTLDACGAPQHTWAASDTGSQTAGAGDTQAGFLLCLHCEPAPPMPFLHPTLPSGGTQGGQQRGKWVFRVAVWERWERSRREDTEHVGRNCLLAVQVQCSFLQMIL